MPRTKAARKKVQGKPCPFAAKILEQLEANAKHIQFRMEQSHKTVLANLRTELNVSKLSLSKNLTNKTMGELVDLPLNWSGNNTTASIMQVSDATKTLTEKKKHLVRSSSFVDDEGYLTAESSNATAGGDRRSRTRSRVPQTKRVSRSVSARVKKTGSSVLAKYKTPAQKIPINSYGMITPKVKPNTPQVLLRRPKQGEVALSLQGSPLFTGTVVSENVANINIPLEGGRLLSIQPQRGLRISQIPELDLETKRQLETLRDNLNKVCSVSHNRYVH